LWTHDNHAIAIDPNIRYMGESKLGNIHNNPVEAGIVETAAEYLYSSAMDYAGRRELVKLVMW